MVRELMEIEDENHREFGIVATKDGHSLINEGASALYPVGTATVLREAEEMEDGRFNIVTTGSRRFTILEVDTSTPLLRAEVQWLADEKLDHTPEVEQLTHKAVADFASYRAALSGQLDEELASVSDMPADPEVVSFLLTAAIVLPTADRQRLLSATSTAERLALARIFMQKEIGFISHLRCIPALDLFTSEPSTN